MMEALCDECGRVFAVALRPAGMARSKRHSSSVLTAAMNTSCAERIRAYGRCRNRPIDSASATTNVFNGGELNRWHIGHMRRKMNLLRGRLDAMNRAE